jgi:hypothetical protein
MKSCHLKMPNPALLLIVFISATLGTLCSLRNKKAAPA